MSKRLHKWVIVPYCSVSWKWRMWTGKKSMMGWCCGDCLDNPINWDYTTALFATKDGCSTTKEDK